MWGNSLGWAVSMVIVALTATIVYVVSASTRPARPTDFSDDPAHFAAIVLPALPAGALPAPMEQDSDAGELYRLAIGRFEQERILYERFAASGTLASPDAEKLQAIDLLLQAASRPKMNLFAARPRDVVNYDHEHPPIEALRTLGKVCVDRLGLLNQKAGHADEAIRFYQAGFALGHHLARERVCYAELELGMELLSKTVPQLASVAESQGRTGDAAALRAFDAQRLALSRDRIDPVLRIVRTIDPNVVGRHAGDQFELARRSQERMWRVEAVLALGRLRYFVGTDGTAGTQRAAERMVRRLASEEADPVVRTAAEAARDLAAEQHRMQ
jgi:hypothetical protein